MNHALVLSVFSSTFLVLTTLSGATGDPKPPTSHPEQDLYFFRAQQPFDYFPTYLEGGKRSWRDLQGGWGKRGWKDLQTGAWGKRVVPGSGKAKVLNGRSFEDSEAFNDKRVWNDMKTGYLTKPSFYPGIRDRNFEEYLVDMNDDFEDAGSTNKRDPGWQHLKGLWGKRDGWDSLGGVWG